MGPGHWHKKKMKGMVKVRNTPVQFGLLKSPVTPPISEIGLLNQTINPKSVL